MVGRGALWNSKKGRGASYSAVALRTVGAKPPTTTGADEEVSSSSSDESDLLLSSRKRRRHRKLYRSYTILLVSLLATLYSIALGIMAVYDFARHNDIDLQSWVWLISAQPIYAVFLWSVCYGCVSRSYIPRSRFTRQAIHPYTRHLIGYFVVTALQALLIWVFRTTLPKESEHYFNTYRYAMSRPVDYDTTINSSWNVILAFLMVNMLHNILAFISSYQFRGFVRKITK